METEKCFSYGVRRNDKLNTLTMSLILDETTKEKLEEIIPECESKLSLPLSKIFYRKNQNTIYVKLTRNSTFFDENDKEINPIKFENKRFNTNAVLKIESITQSDNKNNLQIKLNDAVVKQPKKESTFEKWLTKCKFKNLVRNIFIQKIFLKHIKKNFINIFKKFFIRK